MIVYILYIIGALIVLYFGANFLVKGAASLAERFGVSALVVGLTVVAFGTSTPELIVSVQATMDGFGGISIGNVVGSNIANIGLILGLSALILPLKAHMQLIRIDTPIMILTSLILMVFFLDNHIGRIEGFMFVLAIVGYSIFNIVKSRKEHQKRVLKEFEDSVPKVTRHWALDVLFILAGLAALIIGSDFLVENSVNLARLIGLSEAVIGLTIVAVGTSTPELATSIVAALKKQPDIAIGNVVGSNIFNILGILGVASLVKPISTPDINLVDMLVMIGMSLLLLPFIKSGFTLRRWEGALLLALYIG
ncbi:MAG: calcium/sodium antiporter, partial [Deltaproteobacteria bacterium]